MKIPLLALAAVPLVLASALADPPSGKLYAIPSWGDYAVVYGPGTDPAMDSPAAMENMFKFWKGRGYAGVFLRSDLQQYHPFVRRNPRVQMNPSLALLWRHIDKLAEKFDYFSAAQQAAQKTGFELWVYHPHIYSDGAPEEVGVPGPGRMMPWSYVSKTLFEHPEMVSVDRQGHKYWMVPEYAYPEARRSKVAEFVFMAKKYGIKQFIANMRSEVNQLINPADKADRFGFNPPVVEEMQRLYGVDILSDPRFDVDSPSFNSHDPLVEKWRDLRGSYLTQLFRELRQGLREVDPQIKIAITLAGEHIGPPLGNWRTDWRTWVDEGLVDYLVSSVFFEATLDPEASKKGYLTNALAGLGTVPHETLRAYIAQSKHPEIGIVATGGPPYFFTSSSVPPGANALQCDVWLSSYHLAWHQRWEQWMCDLKEFGHIKFLEQNFDAVSPADFAGQSGGWGLLAYDPQVRACPGGWWRLGTGADARPFAQAAMRHGDHGQALRLTRAADGSGTLTGFHSASPDRGKYAGALDTAVTNGICTFELWVLRPTPESALAAYLQADGTELDIALRISPETGTISYSTGQASSAAKWVESHAAMPVGVWRMLTLQVDLDRGHYSAWMGEDRSAPICAEVPYSVPKERFVELAGVNIPMAVPVYKHFQRVSFVPEGAPGNITFLDDVSVKWQPTLHFVEHGPVAEFADDFESHPIDEPIAGKTAESAWTAEPDESATAFYVTNDTSFGPGVKSLYAGGGSKLLGAPSHPLNLGAPLTLDFDVFIRSGANYPYIIPNPATKSPHRTTVGLTSTTGAMVAGVLAGEGTWQIWNGTVWSESGVRIDYDVWNHLQLALDGAGSYRVAVQPVGQVPSPVGRGQIGPLPTGEALSLAIEPSKTVGHISCYDNVLITSGKAPASSTPRPPP